MTDLAPALSPNSDSPYFLKLQKVQSMKMNGTSSPITAYEDAFPPAAKSASPFQLKLSNKFNITPTKTILKRAKSQLQPELDDQKLKKRKYQVALQRTKSYKYTRNARTVSKDELKKVAGLKGDKYAHFLEQEKEKLMETINLLVEERDMLKKENSKLETKLAEAETSACTFQIKCEEAEAEAAEAKEAVKQAENSKKVEIEKMARKVRSAEYALEGAQESAARLEKQVRSQESEFTSAVAAFKEREEELKRQLADMQQTAEREASARVTEMEENLKSIKAIQEGAESEIRAADEKASTEALSSIEELETKNKELQSRIQESEAKLGRMTEDYSSMQQQHFSVLVLAMRLHFASIGQTCCLDVTELYEKAVEEEVDMAGWPTFISSHFNQL